MGEYQTGPTVSASPPDIPRIMRRTGPWVRFFGILSLVGAGLTVCAGLFFLVTSLSRPGEEPLTALLMIPAYLIGAGINILLGIFLLRYASRIDRYTATPGDEQLAEALEAQRLYWKTLGVLGIIGLSFMALALIVGVIAAIVF